MVEERLRTAADVLGLLAYLAVMYGGLPERELFLASYRARTEGEADGKETGHLSLVPAHAEPVSGDIEDAKSSVVAAA